MEMAEIVGLRVREARDSRSLSQKKLGEALRPFLGSTWPKQTVSAVERGLRSLDASELAAFALALGYSVQWFLTPPDVGEDVSLKGQTVRPGILLRALGLSADESLSRDQALEVAEWQDVLFELVAEAVGKAEQARDALAGLLQLITPGTHPSFVGTEGERALAEALSRVREAKGEEPVSEATLRVLRSHRLPDDFGPLLEMVPEERREARAEALVEKWGRTEEEEGES
jgi:transcriptional regulator with XRE-family HTH domain